jgi:GLPGLI family protein
MGFPSLNKKSMIQTLSRTAIKNFIAFFMLAILVQCNDNNQNNHISQGIIQYDITYIKQADKKFPIQLMPKTMELKFNKEFSSYSIEDRLGLFCIKNILNYAESKHITLIKVFDKKYVYSGLTNEPPILFESSNNYKFKYKDDTSRIAGFLCKKVDITDEQNNFAVYYTNNIEIDKPNKNTPYSGINGMLLNFRLHIKDMDMQLNGRKFEHKIIDNSQFEVPKGYKAITRKQMEEIITTILP